MLDSFKPSGKEASVCRGRYLLRKKVGRGSFGDIYMAHDTVTGTTVAVKLEEKKVQYPQLEYEMSVYQILVPVKGKNVSTSEKSKNPLSSGDKQVPVVPGIPRVHEFVKEGQYNVMILDLLGPSLEDIFNFCHRRLSLKTVLMLVEQMLHRIEYLHSKGFIHRDIKPENFVFGRGPFGHVLHLIDFGLAKQYIDYRTKKHIVFSDKKSLTGTARYCAANAHRGYEQSRRDDLESIGFLLIYFVKGSLPWQGVVCKDPKNKMTVIGEKKMSTSLESLCEGLPSAFLEYFTYCRSLEFTQDPDYKMLRELFQGVAKTYGYTVANSPDGFRREPTVDLSYGAYNVPFSPLEKCNVSVNATNGQTSTLEVNVNGSENTVFRPNDRFSRSNANPRGSFFAGAGALYDWKFDWFCKRAEEIQEYKAARTYNRITDNEDK